MGVFEPSPSPKNAVFIDGLHTVYPKPRVDEEFMDNVLYKNELGSDEIIAKLRAINKRTGIKSRPVVLDQDDPFYVQPEPYPVEKLTEIWLEHGIPLCVDACQGAIDDWNGDLDQITHLLVATCSVQCHPGVDAYVANALGLSSKVSRILLSGVGCAGGAALFRTANELAMAMSNRNKPARILVVACDLNSLSFRSDAQLLKENQLPIGLLLFSDAASAAVVSNGVGRREVREVDHCYEIKDWASHTIPDSLDKLMLMPTAIGQVSKISKDLQELIPQAVKESFFGLMRSMPKLVGRDGKAYRDPLDFDWNVHPGGLGIFDKIIETMGVTRNHAAATVKTYENWGNSAGPTLLKVLDVSRKQASKKEYVVCSGFGNNIDVTMLILRRC